MIVASSVLAPGQKAVSVLLVGADHRWICNVQLLAGLQFGSEPRVRLSRTLGTFGEVKMYEPSR